MATTHGSRNNPLACPFRSKRRMGSRLSARLTPDASTTDVAEHKREAVSAAQSKTWRAASVRRRSARRFRGEDTRNVVKNKALLFYRKVVLCCFYFCIIFKCVRCYIRMLLRKSRCENPSVNALLPVSVWSRSLNKPCGIVLELVVLLFVGKEVVRLVAPSRCVRIRR